MEPPLGPYTGSIMVSSPVPAPGQVPRSASDIFQHAKAYHSQDEKQYLKVLCVCLCVCVLSFILTLISPMS